MTSLSSAAATGLSNAMSILSQPTPRRGFLAGLAALPLIGGSVALLGRPSGVAEPITRDVLEAYKTWLDMEHRFLCWEMADDPMFGEFRGYDGGATLSGRYDNIRRMHTYVGRSGSYHGGSRSASPYTRAALVLSAVGCDWQEDGL